MARLASLTADRSAPTELSPKQKAELSRHRQVIRLSQKNQALTIQIHAAGYRPISTAKGTPLFKKKKRIEARLNCLKTTIRNHMIEKVRKQHFQKADTVAFDSQFSATRVTYTFLPNTLPTKPVIYHLPERAAVVRLTCTHADGLTEQAKLTQRIQAIEARAALCHRQESRRRRPQYYIKQEEADTSSGDLAEERVNRFPLMYKPTQCIFCLGNESKPYHKRVFEYAKPNKMMNEVEKHLSKYSPQDPVPCPHPQCKVAGLVLPSIIGFKNYAVRVHKIFLHI